MVASERARFRELVQQMLESDLEMVREVQRKNWQLIDYAEISLQNVTGRREPNEAANNDFFAISGTDRAMRYKAFVFFSESVNFRAKYAQISTKFANFAARKKRQVISLAACFFAFFSLSSSDLHSANLSTTPYRDLADRTCQARLFRIPACCIKVLLLIFNVTPFVCLRPRGSF